MKKPIAEFEELQSSIMDAHNTALEVELVFEGMEDWTGFYVVAEVREMLLDAHAKVTEAIEVMQE